MAGIVEQQSCQQVVGFVAHDGAVGPLGEGFLSDRLKQRAIHDWRRLKALIERFRPKGMALPVVVVTLPSLAIYDQIAATVGEAA
jgi:hypothetical protein